MGTGRGQGGDGRKGANPPLRPWVLRRALSLVPGLGHLGATCTVFDIKNLSVLKRVATELYASSSHGLRSRIIRGVWGSNDSHDQWPATGNPGWRAPD